MIEVNLKAKPFNPSEDVIGSELFYMLYKCQLVGRHYYLDGKPSKPGRTVIAIPNGGKWAKVTDRANKLGWAPVNSSVGGFACYRNASGDSLYLTQDSEFWCRWRDAAEVCKLMGLSDIEEHHKLAEQIHLIVVQGFKVEVNKEGELMKLVHRKEAPPEGEANWAPQPAPAGMQWVLPAGAVGDLAGVDILIQGNHNAG